jgi:hypothetical protein
MLARNFDELVIPMAEEAPQAVVLDWYRRLELTIRDYLASRHLRYQTGPRAEKLLDADARLGASVAHAVAELRALRNQIAHGSQSLTPAEAIAFARQSLSLIGRIWIAQDARADQRDAEADGATRAVIAH